MYCSLYIIHHSSYITPLTMQSIVVYCGSSPGKNPVYKEVAIELGEKMAGRGIRLIYGGGGFGLMGTVADTVLTNGGEVTGVIPNFLAQLEVAHQTLTELHFVETMHERKSLILSPVEYGQRHPLGQQRSRVLYCNCSFRCPRKRAAPSRRHGSRHIPRASVMYEWILANIPLRQ